MSDPSFRSGDGLATPHRITIDGGIREAWTSDGGFTADVVYECEWDDRQAFMLDLAGRNRNPQPAPGKMGLFRTPHAYPPFPKIYALDVASVEPTRALAKPGSRWSPYTTARLNVHYGTLRIDTGASLDHQIDQNNPILGCSQKVKGSAAFRTLPEGKLQFEGSLAEFKGSAGRPEAQSEITLEFPHVPFNPYPFLKGLLGTINSKPIFTHGIGEVLFDSVDTDDNDTNGTVEYKVGLNFLCRDGVDWNKLIDDTGAYGFVEYKSGSARIFTYNDFWSNIFGFPADFTPA